MPVLLALACLAAAGPAAASGEAGANIRRSPGESAAFTLAGSNGYSLYFKSEKGMLTIVASRRRPGQATISPTGKLVPARRGATSESTYAVRGVSQDPTQISADLGPAGSVSLAFQPSGKKRVTFVDLGSKSERCIGAAKVTRRLGTFVGTVSFRGENGYTTAEATAVAGTVGTSPFRNCTTVRGAAGGPGAHNDPVPATEALFDVGGDASFFAFRDSDAAHFVSLDSEELSPGFFVLRTATAVGRSSLFSYGPSGTWANLEPPAPFSGTGSYRDPNAGPPSWKGDLSVEFPGFEQPLSGAGMTKPSLKLLGRIPVRR
ncbi:MAG: hypothetical protein ACTHN3_10300 [Solirubrobacterales bacterium]